MTLLAVLFVAASARAQDATSAETPDQSAQAAQPLPPASRMPFRMRGDLNGGWEPLGALPVDQAGASGRGYGLSGEDSHVTAAGSNQFAIHTVAANNFYREQNDEFLISQRYETHTLALDYRRGFKLQGFPRFEIGGQVQLHQSDNGILNGFILGMESLWASMTGYHQSRNELRVAGAAQPPLGTVINRNGADVYRQVGGASGIGDLYLTGKVALVDLGPSLYAPRVAARLGVNLSGGSVFTEGNYVGLGLSLDQKVTPFLAFHGDVRATHALDQFSAWNLPLKRWTYGFSAGPEFRLPKRSSFNLQFDASTTPYEPTGTLGFDKGYGALTFGLGHRFGPATAQLYFRENLNLPFTVRWNTDPDLSVGLRIRVH